MKNIFSKDFKKILLIFVFWRICLLLVSFFSMKLLPFKPSFPYYDAILARLSPYQFIWHWANFDGPHYITLAEKGYIGTGLIQAFFPLYPLLMGLFDKIVKNPLYSGLLISNFSFLFGLYFFEKLVKLEKIKQPKLVLVFLLLFPTSFYFGSLYSESLFFLLVVLSFLFIRQKKWWRASFFASLASATRLVGIFIAPAILWEYWQSQKQKKNYFQALFLAFLSIGGFLLFCLYLNKNFNDPFYFVKVQNAFGASRQTDKLILLHQVVWRYLKMMLTIRNNNILLFSVTQEFLISLLVLGLLIWAAFKKMRRSYLIYSFLSFILPTLTGNFSSMPRYVSLIFPIYFIFASIKKPKVRWLILSVFLILLIINTALFLRGFWVA